MALIVLSCAGSPSGKVAAMKPVERAPSPGMTTSAGDEAAPATPVGEVAAAAAPAPKPAPREAAKSKTEADTARSPKARGADKDAAGPAPEFASSDDRDAAAVSRPEPRAVPSQSGLKAGYSDDNEQFNYFAKFIEQYKAVPHVDLAIGERIAIKVLDSEGRSVSNADLVAKAGGKVAASGKTYADGSFYLYPQEAGDAGVKAYEVTARYRGLSAEATVTRDGPRTVTLALEGKRAVPSPLPVDVLFVLDTTGSMGEEIERLRSTIEIISENITALKPKPSLRFGMVLYRDREDDYVTKVVPFTADLARFQKALDETVADGGGDEPEDLQSAMRDAVKSMKWNADGIRLGFIVTDASPQLDYGQSYTYADAAREAKSRAIKFFSIGAGGLPLEGEYPLRQIAQYTQGKYIFLTYGEKGESAGGKEGSVSHHTGSNFSTDKLEAIVIKFVRDEIARQSDKELESELAYSEAKRIEDESREDTLGKLFAQSIGDLSDYSSLKLPAGAKLAVMPLAPASGSAPAIASQAEYFGSQLSLAATKAKAFTIVERGNLQAILGELELQLSGLADEESAAKAGKLLGADYLVTGTVFAGKERYEIFLKLVRVETAEVLSATKAKLDLKLGL
jgi:Mg-chelatase subunit ChlD/TolB-like protein